MKLALNTRFNSPFSEGTGVSDNIPAPYQVAINGRPYLVDLSFQPWKRQAMRTTSIDQTRTQADTSGEPGEQTLNPEALWRRSQDTWNHGAGQTNLDRKESDIAMFRSSKGVDPWTLWQLALQKDTRSALASANTNLALAVAGSYLYAADGQALKYTQDVTVGSPTWSTTTGTPADTLSSIASDGTTVYAAYGAGGLYTASAGGAAAQLVSTGLDPGAVVGYCNGRLMVGDLNSIYNVTSTALAALPTALMTKRESSFRWVGFAEGNGFVYAAGYSGSKSLIYSITLASDGSALGAPVQAGQLPIGEIVEAVHGYLGFIAIGTNRGLRLATSDASGHLTIGPLVSVANPVLCLDGQDRFVFFGWSNYDASSTGLGRADLTQFPVLPQAPAYATDLMSPSGSTIQGSVLSVAYFQSLHIFAVSGQGLYVEHPTNYVPSGTIQSGVIVYDLADKKLPMFVDVMTDPLVGKVSASIALDDGTFQPIGVQAVAGSTFTEFLPPQTLSNQLEVQLTLTAPNTPTSSPTIHRVTTRAIPAAVTGNDIYVPLRLHEYIEIDENLPPVAMDPVTEWTLLESLRRTHEIVTYQEGKKSLQVYLADMDWIPEAFGKRGNFNGVCVVTLKQPV